MVRWLGGPIAIWSVFVSMALLRLVLSSHHDVVAYLDDDHGYAMSSLEPFWDWTYSAYSHVRQPIYPLFVHVSTALGLPARLAIEGVWIGAAAVLLAGLRRCGLNGALALIVSGQMLLHPWSFWLLDRMLQDTLYTPAMVAMTIAIAAAAVSVHRRELLTWGAVSSVGAALAASTRPESAIVWGVLGLAAIIVILGKIVRRVPTRLAMARLGAAALVPGLAAAALLGVVREVNHRVIGIRVTQDLSSPGMGELFDTLLAIPPERPRVRVPIMRDVREAAYGASPTFASLKPWIDGPHAAPGFLKASRELAGVDGEYSSWMLWAIRRAAWESRPGWTSAKELDEFYRRAAREIRDARAAAGLPMRSVPLPFVAPEWRLYLEDLPGAMARSWNNVHRIGFLRPNPQNCPPAVHRLFDRAALRRTAIVQAIERGRPPEEGWLSASNVQRLDRVKFWLGDASQVLTLVWLAAGPLGAIAGAVVLWRGVIRFRWGVLFALALAAFLARTALVLLLDMNGVPTQARYLFPSVLLLSVVGAAGLQACVVLLMSFGRREARVQT